MKPSAPCCTRTPASRCHTRPSPVTAARCWIQPGQRSRVVPRRRRPNHRQPPKGNCHRVHQSASHGHANRASRLQRIFSAAVQVSPVAATVERLQSNPPILKSKNLWVQIRDQRTLHSPVTRARRGRIMENAVALRFRLELGVAAPARGFTHAVPPRRLPLTAANSRPKQSIITYHPRRKNTAR